MWHWILNEDSLMAFHSIIYWITILPWSKKLISGQFFPKDIVPRSIFTIEGVMLINTSTNLKQKFQLTTNADGFSKKEKKRKKIFQTKTKTQKQQQQKQQQQRLFNTILCWYNLINSKNYHFGQLKKGSYADFWYYLTNLVLNHFRPKMFLTKLFPKKSFASILSLYAAETSCIKTENCQTRFW